MGGEGEVEKVFFDSSLHTATTDHLMKEKNFRILQLGPGSSPGKVGSMGDTGFIICSK